MLTNRWAPIDMSANFTSAFTSECNRYESVSWSRPKAQHEVMIHPRALVICKSIHSFAALLAHEIRPTIMPRGAVHPVRENYIKELSYELQAFYSKAELLELSLRATDLSPEQIRHREISYVVREDKREELKGKTEISE